MEKKTTTKKKVKVTDNKMDFLNKLKKEKDLIKNKNKKRETEDTDFFMPTIKPDDNILSEKIKEIIINEKINIKNLDWENENEKNNYKSGLRNNPTMSVARFERWLELLDKTYTLEVFDK